MLDAEPVEVRIDASEVRVDRYGRDAAITQSCDSGDDGGFDSIAPSNALKDCAYQINVFGDTFLRYFRSVINSSMCIRPLFGSQAEAQNTPSNP